MQVLAAPFAGVARAHFQGVQRGELIAVGDVALALAMLVASAVCVAADLGFAAIAAATASGYVAQALVMTALLPRGIRLAWGMRWAVWRDMLRISLPLGATLIINYLYFRLDVLLLAILRDTDAVAIYGLAYRVLEGLMVFPMYFMLALFPEIARLSADRARVDAIVVAALAAMEVIALPLVALGIVFADDIVTVIGGTDFADAASVLRILMLALGLSYVNGVYGNALLALGRQDAFFRWSLVILGFNLVANLVLIPPFGVEGAAVAVVLSEALAFCRDPPAVRRGRAEPAHPPGCSYPAVRRRDGGRRRAEVPALGGGRRGAADGPRRRCGGPGGLRRGAPGPESGAGSDRRPAATTPRRPGKELMNLSAVLAVRNEELMLERGLRAARLLRRDRGGGGRPLDRPDRGDRAAPYRPGVGRGVRGLLPAQERGDREGARRVAADRRRRRADHPGARR